MNEAINPPNQAILNFDKLNPPDFDGMTAQVQESVEDLIKLAELTVKLLQEAHAEIARLTLENTRLHARLSLKTVECVALRMELMEERVLVAALTEKIENEHAEDDDE